MRSYERLVDAESAHYGSGAPAREDHRREPEHSGQRRKRKKRSFLEEFFE